MTKDEDHYHNIPWAERDYTHWSEIDCIRTCPRQHFLRYKNGLEPKARQVALDRGSLWHELMDDTYSPDPETNPASRLIKWRDEKSVHHDDIDLLTWMLEGYFEAYGPGDPVWADNVVAVELELEAMLPDVGFGRKKFKGSIDLIVEWLGRLWIIDHKTGKVKPSSRSLPMLDQWTIYTWLARENGYDIFGTAHNYAKTIRLKRDMTLEERFERTPIDKTDIEVETVAREFATVVAYGHADNGAPLSPGDHCHWCDFRDYCPNLRKRGANAAWQTVRFTHNRK